MANLKSLPRFEIPTQKTLSSEIHLYGKSISGHMLLPARDTAFILTVALTITTSPIVLYIQLALLILLVTVEYGVSFDVPLSMLAESYFEPMLISIRINLSLRDLLSAFALSRMSTSSDE